MYQVSDLYKQIMKTPDHNSKMNIIINSDTYTEDNILEGSFSLSNQCTETSDITLGSVFVGNLSATLRNVNIARNNWIGQVIKPSFLLKIAENQYESVPLGIYTIEEADWSKSGVVVKAYDNMTKFDKNFGMNQSSGYLYDFLVIASTECGVELGQTEAQLKAMTNGDIRFDFYSENDIETWRDLIYWVAQTMGGFATIDRQGKLVIRQYGQQNVDTLDTYHRHNNANFSDYTTKYTGVSYVDVSAQATRYYGAAVDDGTTMNLGSNPFLQDRTTAETACENILTAIANIRYVPFRADNIGDPAYDLGDVLEFTGGLAGTTSKCCLQKFTFDFHRKFEMSGYGANPAKANAKSKVDKNIAGLLAETKTDQMAFYEARNAEVVSISDGERKQIIALRMAVNSATKIQVHTEINLNTISGDSTTTKVTASYIISGNEDLLHPKEIYIDGDHVMHLMYIVAATPNQIIYFTIYMGAENGTITINREGVWLYASGLGMAGDENFSGVIELSEMIPRLDFIDNVVLFNDVVDNVTITVDEV